MNWISIIPPKFQKYASFGVIPKLLLAPVAFLILCGFLLLKPFVHLRLYRMIDTRIGHLATNTELVRLKNFSEHKNANRKEVIVYCSESKICSNTALRQMFVRNSLLFKGHTAWLLVNMAHKIRLFNSVSSHGNKELSVDIDGLLSKYPPTISFNQKEIETGEKFLSQFSLNKNKLVCLFVRDSEYFKHSLHINDIYHEYRNSSISTYVAASEILASLGYNVLRMGAKVKEPLHTESQLVFDYAYRGCRTELLDVYLGAVSRFNIVTASGWDSVPTIFRRPIMRVNHLPIFQPSSLSINMLIYPKLLIDKATHSVLTLSKIIKMGIVKSQNTLQYSEAQVEIRDLSSEELVEAVTEMAQRVEGTFVETPEQKEMQAKLKHILSTHPKLQPSPNYFPIRAQFASCFLSRYPNFLDGLD